MKWNVSKWTGQEITSCCKLCEMGLWFWSCIFLTCGLLDLLHGLFCVSAAYLSSAIISLYLSQFSFHLRICATPHTSWLFTLFVSKQLSSSHINHEYTSKPIWCRHKKIWISVKKRRRHQLFTFLPIIGFQYVCCLLFFAWSEFIDPFFLDNSFSLFFWYGAAVTPFTHSLFSLSAGSLFSSLSVCLSVSLPFLFLSFSPKIRGKR